MHIAFSLLPPIGILLLFIHFYLQDYSAFEQWGLRSTITDQLVQGFLSNLFQQYEELPVIRNVTNDEILAVASQVRNDVEYIISAERARISNSPDLGHLGGEWEDPA